MRLFGNSIFSIANLFGFLIGIAMFGSMIFIPVYLQVVDGMSPTRSGLAMLPMVVGIFSTSIAAGQMMSRTGKYKIYPILGAAVVIVALGMLSQLTATSPYWYAGLSMYVLGAGLGFTMQILITVVQNSVDRSDIGVATSSVTFFRQMGGSFGTALFGAVLSSRLAVHIADAMASAPASAQRTPVGDVANNVQAIKALPEPVHSLITGAFSQSLHDVFLTAVPLVVVALVVAFFIKEKPLASRENPAAGAPRDADGADEPEVVVAH
jgi:Major Facilitator Superfamily